MSWSEHCVQDHRQRTDRAIHRAFGELAADPSASETFHELLLCARNRAARLFEAPSVNGRHPGVEALVNLSRFRDSHIRSATTWGGSSSSWRLAVSALAHHLVGEYQVPLFLASSWYATDPSGDRKRRWFMAHSRGASFRSLDLPVPMTRKMEHIFLASHDHLSIEHAMRRAELLALGAPSDLIAAVMATRLATDLDHGEFWRTVWLFLIDNSTEIDLNQIGPMIDYIQAVRHERITMQTPEGAIRLDPHQPDFSIKGRTVQSMLRLVQDWHRTLGSSGPAFSWTRSPFEPYVVAEPNREHPEEPKRWVMLELTNSAQLRSEGVALHHCVASYADRCYRGISSIWSLRLWHGEAVKHVLTVEVDPRRRTVVQARGRANRAASGKTLQLLQDWAVRERLQMAV